MIMKVPSNEWPCDFEYVVEEEDVPSLSDIDDEPDFSEYLWMENEEEFDKTELKRLEEEEIMNECMEAMLEDEMEEQINQWEKNKTEEMKNVLSTLPPSRCDVENSQLNPLAVEFVPKSQVDNLVTS